MASGSVGMLCCLGPTALAGVGAVSAGTAITWANHLYDGYAWWFRAAGVATSAGLAWHALWRRDQCTVDGVRAARRGLAIVAVSGLATYGALYALTTWLGDVASRGST